MGYGRYMKRTAIVALTCIVISLTSVNPAHSYSKPSDSYDDAVAAALARFNAADVAYNAHLALASAAEAVWIPLNAAEVNAKAIFDAAFAEYRAADAAKWQSLTSRDEAIRLAAIARAEAATIAKDAAYNAWVSARSSASNASLDLRNARTGLGGKLLNRTLSYNLYLEALAIAGKNKTGIQLSPKVLTPNSNPASETIANAPIIKYKNCNRLRKTFPKGVAKNAKLARKTGATVNANVYNLNSEFDRDKDGIVCEVV
jgi:hypothetical protein